MNLNYAKLHKFFLTSACLLISAGAFCQLTVSSNQVAAALAAKLAGPGISISSPVLTCASAANGTFVSTATPLTIDSGIILTSGSALSAAGFESSLASTNNGGGGDAALTTLAGTATHDACVLEFDFIPNGDTVSFNYQFGSEEYDNSTCGQYNDAFAFFISGPGITGSQNIALVPGTNIPVTVNSINNGVPGSPNYPGYCNIANCTNMGPGSPFTGYYYDNTGGTQLTYKGFTKKLAAVHDVMPCNTYHLRIAIADASNGLYDSGVFIEAGSLKTNSLSFSRTHAIGATVNGLPNTIVRGCAPAAITVLSNRTFTTQQTVHFSFGGTALSGVDYTAPDSAIIASGSDSVVISIAGLITAPTGTKSVKLFVASPLSCGIVDSITVNIIDTPSAVILTPNTAICRGSSIQILTGGTSGLAYSWSPAATLGSATVMQPTATPTAATTYTMTATLPGTGCPPITQSVTISVTDIGVSILTPDTTVCLGASVNMLVNGDPAFTYSWLPASGLTDPSAKEPSARPSATTTYTLTATSHGGCPAIAHVTITVAPANAVVLTTDTVICAGQSVTIPVTGDASLQYSWAPATGLDNAGSMQPVATPTTTTTYNMLATVPGSFCSATGSITIQIESVPVNVAPSETLCLRAAIMLSATTGEGNYSFLWSGPAEYTSDQQAPIIYNAAFANQGIYTITVTDNVTGCSATGYTTVNVVPPAPLTNVTASQSIAYGGSIQLNAGNAVYYRWTPEDGTISNPDINNPIARPLAPTTYTVYGIDVNGCTDSAKVTVTISYDTLLIPSAFTPNGDGLNDLFRIVNPGYYKLVEMSVYNRWGALVFHSTDGNTQKGWDGTYNGIPQDIGVFNYIITVNQPDGLVHSFKGDVTLIR